MDTNERPTRIYKVALNFEAYRDFFKDKWKMSLIERTDETPLEVAATDLLFDWDGIGNLFAFPNNVMENIDDFLKTLHDRQSPVEVAKRIAQSIGEQLSRDEPSVSRGKIMAAATRAASTVTKTRRSEPKVTANDLWTRWIPHPRFTMCLRATQRLAYGSLYHAYENYLRHVIEVIKGVADYRFKHEDIKQHLGQAVFEHCFDRAELRLARYVRHSLAHAGGRMTSDLIKERKRLEEAGLEFPFEIQDETLQLLPIHIAELYDLLCISVDLFTDSTLAKLSGSHGSE